MNPEINSIFDEISSIEVPSASKVSYYNLDYSTFTNDKTVSVTYDSTTFIINFSVLEITQNEYKVNFGEYGKGLVDIRGFQRVKLTNEYYIYNGENTVEVLKTFGTIGTFEVMSEMTAGTETVFNLTKQITSNYIDESSYSTYQLKSIIYVEFCGDIVFSNVTSFGNYLLETGFTTDRALFLYASQFFGRLYLDTLKIIN